MQKDRQPKRPDQGWTREEKARGTPQGVATNAAEGADEAGTAAPMARPNSDREATEQAAAATEPPASPTSRKS
jgi:hypothetical protein